MQSELKVQLGFAQRRLPWLIAGAAFLFYLVTLNHSSTFAGISSLAKADGWDWRSNLVAPLHTILTYGTRWLPPGVQLSCLNVLAAAAAALALGLLARSVALLPHDRTREQRALERSEYSLLSLPWSWLPPLLAALVCGLQLSFWENAVVATGEAFDLLLFAWLVDCLLRYRLDEKPSRLNWFAFVYGLAITNNFAMIAFAPAFLLSLFWIRGTAFFNWRFLLRMFFCGLAGLSVYMLLPLAESLTNLSGFGFWELLTGYWGFQKNALLGTPRYIIIFSSLTSILPVLFVGIRWPAQFGESSAAGNALTNLMTHVIHAVFFIACVYVAFDPPFSPRRLSNELYAMLPMYYLGALAIGYCSGYFLLVFGAKPGPHSWQRPSPLRRAINLLVVNITRLALVAVPVALFVQNIHAVWSSNGHAMSRLSARVAKELPASGAFVLSDDAFRLHALQYELLKSQPNHAHVLIDTSQLQASGYHRFLQKKYPNRWPKAALPDDPKANLDSQNLIQMLGHLTQRAPVFYLHPSFGYYFEYFYLRPQRSVYELKAYEDPMVISPPVMTAEEIKREDEFWRSIKTQELDPLIRTAPPFVRSTKPKPRRKTLEAYLSEVYSRTLDDLAVSMERAGDYAKAAEYLELACQLNPRNPVSLLNLEFNRVYRTNKLGELQLTKELEDRLREANDRWDVRMGLFGPVEEPQACFKLADTFQDGLNFRQAGQNYERVLFYRPESRAADLNLMLMCVKNNLGALALQKLADYRRRHPANSTQEEEEMDLLRIEGWGRVINGDLPGTEQLLTSAQAKYPKQSAPWEIMSDIYATLRMASNALSVLERQIQAQPESVRALVNYGAMLIRLNRAADALPFLDKALKIDPRDEACLMNRGLANLGADRLDAAEQDFRTVLNTAKSSFTLNAKYQLAEVYWRKKNRRETRKLYVEFLKEVPPYAPQVPFVKDRLQRLDSGAPL